MTDTHTLTRHRDIQNWVTDRRGLPAIARIRDRFGDAKARLCLSFTKSRAAPLETPGQDDGMMPVSWNAWLAELDRQHLALKVSEQAAPDFEFVSRQTLN